MRDLFSSDSRRILWTIHSRLSPKEWKHAVNLCNTVKTSFLSHCYGQHSQAVFTFTTKSAFIFLCSPDK